MIFTPKKQKFKKSQKRRSFFKINSVLDLNQLKFGSFALKSVEPGILKSKQIESIFQSINKIIKKSGRIVLKVFSHEPVCKKPIEVRMGKGKGNVSHWVTKIKAGTILCEVESNVSFLVLKALKLAQIRLPIRTKIIIQK